MNDTMAWRKSSFSSATGNCIEIGDLAENGRVVRDSKDPTGPVLTVRKHSPAVGSCCGA